MRRALFALLMLFSLSLLFARPTLVVQTRGESPSYTLVSEVVERVTQQSLLSRIDGEGELLVTISNLVEPEVNSLSADLLFSYEERTLQLCLSANAKGDKQLSKALHDRLSSQLLYDGLSLFETDDGLLVDYTYKQGYASLDPLRKGDYYTGLDAELSRLATVVVHRSFDAEQPVSRLVGISGEKLLPGMRLEKQAGKSVSLSLSNALTNGGSFGIEALYSQQVGFYPFALILGLGANLTDSALSLLYGQAGLAVQLPLSMVFGVNAGLWRNSSFIMQCSLGLGSSLGNSDLLLGSSAVLTYRYALQRMAFELGIGNKNWASSTTSTSSGLFIQLGLAYTW